MKPGKPFISKIVGSSFCNGEEVIKTLKPNDLLKYVREPQNKHDSNAIVITSVSGKKIGYLPRELAKEIVQDFTNGKVKYIEITVNQITGSEETNLGCNVLINPKSEIEPF